MLKSIPRDKGRQYHLVKVPFHEEDFKCMCVYTLRKPEICAVKTDQIIGRSRNSTTGKDFNILSQRLVEQLHKISKYMANLTTLSTFSI